jgi:hypothetical protein
VQAPINGTYKLTETVPDYFSGIVLQRHHLASGTSYGTIKFQLAFNLAVVWMIVFVSLSKGLRSYGKVIYVFTLVPVFGTFVLCAKILGMMPTEYINIIFPETTWNEFFLNPKVNRRVPSRNSMIGVFSELVGGGARDLPHLGHPGDGRHADSVPQQTQTPTSKRF